MAHGFFAPIVASFIVLVQRKTLLPALQQSSWWGVGILAAAASLGIAGTIGESTTITRFALLLSLIGCALVLGGRYTLLRVLFPIALLLYTFPIPPVLYAELTLPLQITATRIAEAAFELIGYSVVRDGNILELAHQRLSVVEACSGIRSLVTLSFFCLVYTYFFEQRPTIRAFVVLSSIPAAIALNAVRIVTTGVLGEHFPEMTHGIYHESLGWLVFALAFGLVVASHLAMKRFNRAANS